MTEQSQPNLQDGSAAPNGQTQQEGGLASPPIPSTPPGSANDTPREKPDWLPDAAWNAEKREANFDKLGEEFKGLAKFKSDDEARRAALPKIAADYKADLPADFKLPEGWKINEADPMWAKARDMAVKNGLSQTQFSELAAMYVGSQVAQFDHAKGLLAKRDADLGPDAGQRIEGLHKWVDAVAGDAAPEIKAGFVTAKQIAFFEKVKDAMIRQGVPGFNNAGRADLAADPNSIPGFATMTFEQRMAAARNASRTKAA